MSFIKGMIVGVVTGVVAGMVVMPKPKRRCAHMRKSADKAARSIGELVDSIIAVLV
jgi:gas vesicle protein